MLLDIIGMLIIGLVVGLLARFLVPGKDPMGCIGTTLLGVAGAFLGGFLYRALSGAPSAQEGYVRPGFFVSLIGALLLVILFRAIRRR